MNNTQLLGYIATDLKLEDLPGGQHKKAEFRLSVRRAKPAKDGRDADFFSVVAFDKTAETLAKYKGKGDQILIDGRLTTDEWKTENDEPRSKTYIVVDRLHFVGKAPATDSE